MKIKYLSVFEQIAIYFCEGEDEINLLACVMGGHSWHWPLTEQNMSTDWHYCSVYW